MEAGIHIISSCHIKVEDKLKKLCSRPI